MECPQEVRHYLGVFYYVKEQETQFWIQIKMRKDSIGRQRFDEWSGPPTGD